MRGPWLSGDLWPAGEASPRTTVGKDHKTRGQRAEQAAPRVHFLGCLHSLSRGRPALGRAALSPLQTNVPTPGRGPLRLSLHLEKSLGQRDKKYPPPAPPTRQRCIISANTSRIVWPANPTKEALR